MSRRSAWVPVGVWLLMMLTLTSLPSLPSGPDLPNADKLAHVAVFAVLGGLLRRAFGGRQPGLSWQAAGARSFAAGFAYGVLDELHQIPIPGRTCSPWDLLADACGLACGIAVGYFVECLTRGNRQEG